MRHLTLTILRASTTKAPKLSLKTFVLLRSKEWQRPFADMTLVRADVSTLLKPSSFCSASSCSPAQPMRLPFTCRQTKLHFVTRHVRSVSTNICQITTWQISVASVAWSKPSNRIVCLHCGLCQSQISAGMITCKLNSDDRWTSYRNRCGHISSQIISTSGHSFN